MNRNKLLAIIILVLIFGGAAFWIVWGIMLNGGTVVFNFDRPPYTANIGEQTKTCLAAECEFWVPAGPRAYIVTKDGYYEKSGSVNVARDKKTTENLQLEFIPQTLEGAPRNIFMLPPGYSKFANAVLSVSLFAEFPADYSLKSLPKILNNIVFSATGNKAFVFEENKARLYSVRDFTFTTFDEIKDSLNAVFSSDENGLYTVSYDAQAKKSALKKIYLNENKPARSLVYFGRDIINYEISVSDNEKYIALADKTFSPEILYIIDLEKSTRTNVFEGHLIENGKWSGTNELFVFKAKGLQEDFSRTYAYNSALQKAEKLPFEAAVNNIDFIDGQAVFVTPQPYTITNYSVPYSVQFREDAPAATIEEMLDSREAQKTLMLVKWDIKSGQFYLVKDLLGLIENVPEKIELSPDRKVVRMLIDGMIYDIKISE